MDYILASSIIGAVRRKIIQNNIRDSKGNCHKIHSPSDILDCGGCSEKENCAYLKLINSENIRITNFYPIGNEEGNDSISLILNSPVLPRLGSIYERRVKDVEKPVEEFLLFLFLHNLVFNNLNNINNVEGSLIEKFMNLKKRFNLRDYKRRRMDCYCLENHEITSPEIKYEDFAHCAIDYRTGSTIKEKLYFSSGLSKGMSSFYAYLILGDELNIDIFKGEFSIGMGRSRGFGKISIEVIEEMNIEKYIKLRGNKIKESFENLNEFLREFGIKGRTYGIVSGLTNLPLKINGNNINNAKSANNDMVKGNKIELLMKELIKNRIVATIISCKELLNVEYIIGDLKNDIRYDSSLFNGLGGLVRRVVLNAGYTGIYSINKQTLTDEIYQELATSEFSISNIEPWNGWIFYNHPIFLGYNSLL
ncbi:MAG: hypothetical protein ACTSRZ_05725 [Promethearchaeota archaeon]